MATATEDQQTETVGEEQSTVVGDKSATADHAAESRSGVPDTTADDDADETAAIELIPKARYDELKSDPVKLHKELNRAATKKFQEVAKERKALAPYRGFINALEEDPRAAIRALGTQLGVKFVDDEEDDATTATDIGDLILADVKKSLGPEYEDLAEKLAPAIRQVAERVAATVAKPIEDRVGEVITDSAVRESKLAMDAFAVKHPDWNTHEEAMVAMSAKLSPGPGLSEADYLENIYYLVTREKSSGDAVRKVVDKMTKSAGAGGKGSSSVNEEHVSERPLKPPTFTEAYQAAKKGIRFE